MSDLYCLCNMFVLKSREISLSLCKPVIHTLALTTSPRHQFSKRPMETEKKTKAKERKTAVKKGEYAFL